MVQSFAPMTAVTRPIATVPQPRRYSPEDLLRLPDGVNFELVDGQLVERQMGTESSWVAVQLVILLGAHCKARNLGWVFGADASFQCFPDAPDKVRKPDVSFVRLDRLAGGPPKGHCRVAPDLAVEVISPNELYSEVEEKVAEYLAAGVQLVWVIDPPTRSARVHRADGTVANLGAGDELSGESVVPGFHCPVADLFTAPRPAAG
jgi:Uma2 family endonuclease